MNELYEWWGERLRDRRQELGLDQIALAKAADTTQSTVSRIERGAGAPSDALKYRLAAALKTSVKELFPYPPAVPTATASRAGV